MDTGGLDLFEIDLSRLCSYGNMIPKTLIKRDYLIHLIASQQALIIRITFVFQASLRKTAIQKVNEYSNDTYTGKQPD
jgi:hypothetical protein